MNYFWLLICIFKLGSHLHNLKYWHDFYLLAKLLTSANRNTWMKIGRGANWVELNCFFTSSSKVLERTNGQLEKQGFTLFKKITEWLFTSAKLPIYQIYKLYRCEPKSCLIKQMPQKSRCFMHLSHRQCLKYKVFVVVAINISF